MDLLNIGNQSKTFTFKTFKCVLYKYYPKLVKAYKNQSNRLDIKHFLAPLYDCVPDIKHFWSIDRLLKMLIF